MIFLCWIGYCDCMLWLLLLLLLLTAEEDQSVDLLLQWMLLQNLKWWISAHLHGHNHQRGDVLIDTFIGATKLTFAVFYWHFTKPFSSMGQNQCWLWLEFALFFVYRFFTFSSRVLWSVELLWHSLGGCKGRDGMGQDSVQCSEGLWMRMMVVRACFVCVTLYRRV